MVYKLTCLRTFVPLHLTCLPFKCELRAFTFYLPDVISFFYILSLFRVLYLPSFLYLPNVSSVFTWLYFFFVPSFIFTCLTCPHLFTCLYFIKCFQFLTNNPLQQAGIRKNVAGKNNNSVRKANQLWTMLENYFLVLVTESNTSQQKTTRVRQESDMNQHELTQSTWV